MLMNHERINLNIFALMKYKYILICKDYMLPLSLYNGLSKLFFGK